jgi:hypothetical protein
MSAPQLPSPSGADWKAWAGQLVRSLTRQLVQLVYKSDSDVATEDGILLWDAANGYPVVSKNNEWRQIVLEDGHAGLSISSNVTAAAANTAYALTYTLDTGSGISLGTPASRIVFEEGGVFLVSFSAQIASSSSSTVDFYFWPRINGVDVPGATMKNALHRNNATLVVSRSAVFEVNAGDYLEAMWAVSGTAGSMRAFAATAFCPATPASTLAIRRLHA